jgi:hypothetical protein
MLRLAFAALMSATLFAGCKQGEGEYCQIDDDCQSGLTCNQQLQRCQRRATTPQDPGPPDAEPPDADTADVPDAEPPDAEPI